MSKYTDIPSDFNDAINYMNSHPKVHFRWLYGQTTTVSSNNGMVLSGDLNSFMHTFLTTGDARSLALYNGEMSGGSFSSNYGSCSWFHITIDMTYNP